MFDQALQQLIANALNDSQTIMATRIPEEADLRRLFTCAFNGEKVNF